MSINVYLAVAIISAVAALIVIYFDSKSKKGEIEMKHTFMRKKKENGTKKVENIYLVFYVKYFLNSYSTCSIEQAGINIHQLFMSSVNKIEAPGISKIWDSDEDLLGAIKKIRVNLLKYDSEFAKYVITDVKYSFFGPVEI